MSGRYRRWSIFLDLEHRYPSIIDVLRFSYSFHNLQLFLLCTCCSISAEREATKLPAVTRKQHARGALVITRFRCSLAV